MNVNSKKIFLVALSASVLLAGGCSDTSVRSNSVRPTPTSTAQQAGEAYPSGIYVSQLKTARAFGETMYEFVLVPNANYDIPELKNLDEAARAALWHGVLIGEYGGEKWNKWFQIIDPVDPATKQAVKVNPVGIFMKGTAVYLDVVDDRGAGSGEGNLTRLQTKDGGKTWKTEGCYYYVPEQYHPSGDLQDMERIAPYSLKKSKGCLYNL